MKRHHKQKRPRVARDPGTQYGLALQRMLRAEAELLRVFHRWEKARRMLTRREKTLDAASRIQAEQDQRSEQP